MVERKSVFVISTVRNASRVDEEALKEYKQKLLNKDYDVYIPNFDTKQEGDPIGLRICSDNAEAMLKSDEIHVFYNPESQGVHYDIGQYNMMCKLGVKKPIVFVNSNDFEIKDHKDFSNCLHFLDEFYRNGGFYPEKSVFKGMKLPNFYNKFRKI